MAQLHWYVVHAYSGFEKRVAEAISERAQAQGLGDRGTQALSLVVEKLGNR